MSAMFCMLLLWLVGVAGATDVEFCVRLNVEVTGEIGGDYWTSNTPNQEGKGVFLQIYQTNSVPRVFEYYGYTSSSTGCTPPVTLPPLTDYTIIAESRAKLSNDNYVYVYDSNNDLYPAHLYPDAAPYRPPLTGSVSLGLVINPGVATDALAVATQAIHTWRGSLSNRTFNIFPQNGLSAYYSGNNVYLSGERQKFLIAHEIGHVIAQMRDEGQGASYSYGSAVDNCYNVIPGGGGHEMLSKEWQSAAAFEGFADFYASAIWNDVGDSDCSFVYWSALDWDLDGTTDISANLSSFECYGDPCVGTECNNPLYTDGQDFLDDLVDAPDGRGCTLPTAAKSTEFDHMQAYWALMIQHSIPVGMCLDLYDEANPHGWDANESTMSAGDNPNARFYASANGLGILTEWLDEAGDHGIGR